MAHYVVKLTLNEALKLGIVFCECGHPPNNHFGAKSCARCACKKYKRRFSYGKAIQRRKPIGSPMSWKSVDPDPLLRRSGHTR